MGHATILETITHFENWDRNKNNIWFWEAPITLLTPVSRVLFTVINEESPSKPSAAIKMIRTVKEITRPKITFSSLYRAFSSSLR